jgi:hypothetical protein
MTVQDYTLANGGGTFDALTLAPFDPDHGYCVGTAPSTAAYVRDIGMIDRVARIIAGEWRSTFVGTWINDGIVHVDPVTYTVDRDYALSLARKYGQIAIYDCAARATIDVS